MFLASLLLAVAAASQPLTEPEYGPAPGYRAAPAIATDGDGFLAVWADQRKEPMAIYAARLDHDGNALDRTGIRLQERSGNPRVVFAANAYAVLWFTNENGTNTLWVARIDPDGVLIDGPRVAVRHPSSDTMTVAAATNGRRIIVVWNSYYDILDAEGRLIDGARQLPRSEPTVLATNGTTFLTATPARATILDADGNIAMTTPLGGTFPPVIAASDGDGYLLAGGDAPNGPARSAFTQRISAAGIAGEPVSLPAEIRADGRAQLAWTGSSYLLVRDGAALARLDRDGALLERVPVSAGEFYVNFSSIAAAGGRAMFVQTNSLGGNTVGLRAFALDEGARALTAERLVAQTAATQMAPSIASSGAGHGVVWREGDTVRFARPGIDARGIVVGRGSSPRIVFDGRNYVVAWFDGLTVNVARIDPQTGTLLDPKGIGVAGASEFDIESNGSETLIASIGVNPFTLRVTRVDRSGHPTLSVIASPNGMRTGEPSVAWTGTEWLVAFDERIPVYSNYYYIPYTITHVRAVRLSRDLILRDPEPIAVANDEGMPLAASDGAGVVIVSRRNTGVVARRLGGESHALGVDDPSDLLWDGTRYVLAYWSFSGSSYHLATLDAAGAPIAEDVAAFGPTGGTAVLARGNGGVVAAYARMSYEPAYGAVTRVFLAGPPFTPPRGRAVRAR